MDAHSPTDGYGPCASRSLSKALYKNRKSFPPTHYKRAREQGAGTRSIWSSQKGKVTNARRVKEKCRPLEQSAFNCRKNERSLLDRSPYERSPNDTDDRRPSHSNATKQDTAHLNAAHLNAAHLNAAHLNAAGSIAARSIAAGSKPAARTTRTTNSSLQRSTLHRRQTGHSPIERSPLERSPLERSPRERSRTHRSRFDRSRFESRFECPPLLHTFAVVPAAEGWTRESAHRSACSKHIEAHVREACSNREASSNRELVRTRTPHEHAHEERKASQRRRRLQRTSNSPVVVLRSVLLIRIKKSDSPGSN